MEFNVEKFISPFIESQFPSFYKEEGPNFIQFVKAYYEWLEEDGNPVGESRRLFDYRDIDNTPSNRIEDFLFHFQQKYLYGIPYNIIADKRLLLKHIFDVYRSKGNVQCYKLLFRLVYNEDMDVYLPGYDLLKPSDGIWEEPKYLEVTDSQLLFSFVGKKVIGLSSKTSAIVENFIKEPINKNIISTLYLSNIQPKNGEFTIGEKIVLAGGPAVKSSITVKPTLYEILSTTDYNNTQFINFMYELILGVGPGANIFNYWNTQLTQGVSRLSVMASFLSSSEYSNIYPKNETFVESLYKNVLNRPSDINSYNYWFVNLKNNKLSRLDVASGILNDVEFNANIFRFKPAKLHEILIKSIYNDGQFVTRLYEILLNHEPDRDGYNYWTARLAQGIERTTVIKEFILGKEYTSNYSDVNSFLTSLYSNILNRSPDKNGYEYWNDSLNNNIITRAEVVTEFLNGTEFRNMFLNFKTTGVSLSEEDIVASPKVIGSLNTVEIYNGGQDFKVGDELKIVHRDIESGNVISFGVDGTVKVSDVQRFYGSLGFKIDNGGYGYSINALSFVYPFTNNTFTDTPTANAKFSVGMVTYAQEIEYNTDLIMDHVNQSINSISYNFPANTTANNGTPIKDALIYHTDYFGSVYSLTNILTGNNYTQQPYVNVCSVIKSGPLTGTVSYSNTSNTVTGTNTNFTELFKPEDVIVLRSESGFDYTEETIPIKEVISNTSILLYGPPKYSSTPSSLYKMAFPVLRSQLAEYEAAIKYGVKSVSLPRISLRQTLNTSVSSEYFVYKLFTLLLRRKPTYKESQYWMQQINNGTPRGDVVTNILNNSEYNTLYPDANSFVTSLFVNILDQNTPDSNTYDYYVGLLTDQTVAPGYVVSDFISSGQLNNELSNQKFVSRIYNLVANTGESININFSTNTVISTNSTVVSNITYWTDKLIANTTTRPYVVSEILKEYHYQSVITNEQYVTALYNVLLNREPELAGYNYWLNILNSGIQTRPSVANDFLNSLEYLTTDNTTFITKFYNSYLGRSPESGGLTYWLDQLNNKKISRAQFIAYVLTSEEYIADSDSTFINFLYTHVLGRSADTGGYNYWYNLLHTHQLSRGEVIFGFYASVEYLSKHASNADFVTSLYNDVLGRAPDTAGYNYWVGQLNNGLSRSAVVSGFLGSKEYDGLSDADFLTGLYNNILGRAPDAPGLAYWENILATKQATRVTVIAEFLNSTEYTTTNNTSFVTSLYNKILQRAPDAPGLAYWVNRLNTGTTRGDVVYEFLSSSEYLAMVNSKNFIEKTIQTTKYENVTTYQTIKVPEITQTQQTVQTQQIIQIQNTIIEYNYATSITLAQAYSSVNNVLFIRRAYETITNSELDMNNYTYWIALLTGGTTRKQIIIDMFLNYTNLTQYDSFVNGVYSSLFQRKPTSDELVQAVNSLTNGLVTKNQFITSLLNGSEFAYLANIKITGISPDSTISQVISPDIDVNIFIKKMYEVLTGSPPDSSGYSYWLNAINNQGITRKQAIVNFLQTDQFLTIFPDNNSFITGLYKILLNRNPDNTGLTYWNNLVQNLSLSKSDLINAFLNSTEFVGLGSGLAAIGSIPETTTAQIASQQAVSDQQITNYVTQLTSKNTNRSSVIAELISQQDLGTNDAFNPYDYWNAKLTGIPSYGNNIIKTVSIVNSGKGYIDNEDVLLYLTGAVANLHIAAPGNGYSNGDGLVFTGIESSTVANGYILTNSNGSIVQTFLTSYGSGYADVPKVSIYSNTGTGGSVICNALSEFNTYTKVQGKIKKSSIGKGKGFWNSTRGFLNSDKYIQDSYYYQDFSYQINAPVTLNKYKEVLYNTFHTAGNELFSMFQKTSLEGKAGNIDYETSPYYGLSDEKDHQLMDELNNLLEEENRLQVSYEITLISNEGETLLTDESGNIIQQEVL